MSNLLAVFLLLLSSQLELDLRNNQVVVSTDVCSTVHVLGCLADMKSSSLVQL